MFDSFEMKNYNRSFQKYSIQITLSGRKYSVQNMNNSKLPISNLDVLLFKDFLAENIPFKFDPQKLGIL